MKLSIGMIVKNEEKYLEQCLTALKPILENVDSELIIADTGSTDNTVEIAKRFTDNVFHFEWINDFAAARNSTLDKAKGEWYMFIDADEIIKDCAPLIDFFNSGEYKKYGSANYVQRSYNDAARMDLYSDYRPHRLTALLNGIRFESPIHENFDQYFQPVKSLNVIADHYGYVYKDNGKIIDGATEKKTTRNLELLFRELENGSDNVATYGHIADCYFWLRDYDNALKYIDIGLEKCDPRSYTKISFINKKLKYLMSTNRNYDTILNLCNFYFSKENLARTETLVSDNYVYFIWAVVCFNQEDYTEAINKTILGFNIYRSYLNGKLLTPELNYCTVDTTIPILKLLCNIFLTACIDQGKCDVAAREIDNIPIKEFELDAEFMEKHLTLRIEVMEKTNYNKLRDLYFRLDKPNRELFATLLIRNIFRTEKLEQFLKKFSLLTGDNERLDDIVKICKIYFEGLRLPLPMLADFIKKHGTKKNEIVWIFMMLRNLDVTPFICAEDFNAEESVIAVLDDFPNYGAAMDVFKNSINDLTADGVKIMITSFVKALYSATEKKLNITSMIVYFGELGRRLKELDPEAEASDSVEFALAIGEAAELYRKKRYDESVAKLTELVGDGEPSSDSENTKVLRHYLSLVQWDSKKAEEMRRKHNENPAMVEIAGQIKQEIRRMIDNWDLNGAEDALEQMAKMVPFDPDVENLRDEITDRKVNYMKYM